jgi:hypothetical protein
MDMSLVSAKYEKSLPQAIKHVVTGDIVRMLLIQVRQDRQFPLCLGPYSHVLGRKGHPR